MLYIAVDDEKISRGVLLHGISQVAPEADVHLFETADAALDFAGENKVDAAFLDIRLGGDINGIQLAKCLREQNSETHIYFCTGYSEYALSAWDIMAQGYLIKPITPEKLRRTLGGMQAAVATQAGAGMQSPASTQAGSGAQTANSAAAPRMRVVTFGNFTVLVDGKPFAFPRRQCLEIFAYLVHKRGTAVTTRELAAVIYENKEYTKSVKNQMSVYITELMKALRQAGLADAVVRDGSYILADTRKFSCDAYDFAAGDLQAVNSYFGEYMAQYSWAEGFLP